MQGSGLFSTPHIFMKVRFKKDSPFKALHGKEFDASITRRIGSGYIYGVITRPGVVTEYHQDWLTFPTDKIRRNNIVRRIL